MTNRQALHELIETLDEDFVSDILERIQDELAGDVSSLSKESLTSIIKGLEQAAAGQGIPHEEAMRIVGLDP